MRAAFTLEVYDLQLVAKVPVHSRPIESISLAAGAAQVLIKPLLEAVIVKNLLTVTALQIFLLNNVEADGTEEGIHKLLVSFCRVLPHQFVIAREAKHVCVCRFINLHDEGLRLLLLVLLEPRILSEWALVVRVMHVCLLAS